MHTVTFEIDLVVGMTEETLSPHILVDRPAQTICQTFTARELAEHGVQTASQLIALVKRRLPKLQELLGEYGMEQLCCEHLYLRRGDYLLGLGGDKPLDRVCAELADEDPYFVYLFVAGGASRQHMGYTFVVHPREQIHAHAPHVHVVRDGVSVRYSLVDFRRFPQDGRSRMHERDEKKVILPYLRENQKALMEYWELAMRGYLPPVRDEQGRQYCAES